MSAENVKPRKGLAFGMAIVGAFLIAAVLVLAMRHYTTPPPLGKERAETRARALKELRAAENDALHQVGWVDPTKGIVRLRIEDAMQMVEREWRNPAAARSNLLARVAKANAAPPKAPETPSPFE
jgi:uncharacterized protein YdaU (DUF1376 family)